jgi:phospholipid N-methyltransferase
MSAPELKPHTTDDLGHFVKGWIRNPLAIGALAPSGKALAKLMAKDVGAGSRVVELGAGTGTVTAALLAKGVAPADLHLVEADALELERPLEAAAFDFVISGLPLLCFSPDKRSRLLRQGLRLLKPHGKMHQFTYAGRCPIDRAARAELRVDSVLLGIAALNLPPAFVYRFTHRGSASLGRPQA